MNELNCPVCDASMLDWECDRCGYASSLAAEQYETPEGDIVNCSEEEAFDRGYIFICPVDCFNVITWWEMEDHGCCIECWHKNNMLTRSRKSGIIVQ